MTEWDSLADFLFEMGMLKRISREGWKVLGIQSPESVADHSLRAAQIGFILAHLEGYEHPEEVGMMLVFHDIGECRIGDIHKIAKRYIQAEEARAVSDQVHSLDTIGKQIHQLWEQVEKRNTIAGIIAKDADYLEMAVTACEYREKGYERAKDWLESVERGLQTESAKQLFETLREKNVHDWWKHLKKL